jgi:tetratricopeptide (TPR) repeat protein
MNRTRRGHTDLWIGAALFLLVVVVFGQTVGFELVTFDDPLYVAEPAVRAGLSLGTVSWALTTLHHQLWHPLTWISWFVDVELARLIAPALGTRAEEIQTAVHHAGNVVLHAANAALLFGVLLHGTGRRWESAFVAALFAVHPLRAESVAWVTERKDVLTAFFGFLCLLAYQRWARSPSRWSYLAVAVAFALALMSKPMLVTLPVVLLLWDLWPLGRLEPATLRTRIAEKLPLLALSAATVGVAMLALTSTGPLGYVPIGARLANAAISYVVYLEKAIWPTDLSFLYIYPRDTLSAARAIPGALALAVVTALALRAARSRPYLTVGWLWYVITLLPVIGLVQYGVHSRADRYTYVPLIGVFLIVAWGVPDWARSWKWPAPRWRAAVLGAAGGAAVLALAAAAWPVVGHWRNSDALYREALRVDPRNWAAHNNLAELLLRRGHTGEAISHLTAALETYPQYSEARYNLALALEREGELQPAIAEYERLLADNPDHALGHNNLGSLLARLGRFDAAIPHFEAAARLDPENSAIRANLELARQARDGS